MGRCGFQYQPGTPQSCTNTECFGAGHGGFGGSCGAAEGGVPFGDGSDPKERVGNLLAKATFILCVEIWAAGGWFWRGRELGHSKALSAATSAAGCGAAPAYSV